jgi:hypothetical protein
VLPAVVVVSAAVLSMRLVRAPAAAHALAPAAGWTVFAALLLGKMALNPRLHQYGFVLAAPALSLLVLAVVDAVPARLRAHGGAGWSFRAVSLTALALFAAAVLQASAAQMAPIDGEIGRGADALGIDGRGAVLARVMARVEDRVPPAGTLLVAPEGATINYLLRRASSVPYVSLMPPELAMFGEEAILASLEASPPDLVLVANRGAWEYGLKTFGRHFGVGIADWLRARYVIVEQVDDPSLDDAPFSFFVLLAPRAGGSQRAGAAAAQVPNPGRAAPSYR